MNPSVINDNGVLRGILRHVNYTFYHSEAKLIQHPYGPLTYIHPENDLHLRTWNWYFELDDNLNISRYNLIDTSSFDTYTPQWDFVGLEDARIVRWEDDLYITGVRRDTTPHGEGRMELSKIEVKESSVVETARFRIPTPRDPNSYCEKNWMPILDKPFEYIKWSDPTEVVKVLPAENKSETLTEVLGKKPLMSYPRGGSQVLDIGGYYLALTHEVELFNSEVGRKDAIYWHRFLIWDYAWNLVNYSRNFSIMGGHVEFSVGMCKYRNKYLITFGFQDNAAYVLETDLNTIMDFINE
jgi:hypothetical protein